MAVAPLAGVAGALPSLPALPTVPGTAPGAAERAQTFSDMVVGALSDLNATQARADTLATEAATGDLTDVHDYTIAATQATLATELTVAVRNKAVEAFNAIMQMGV